MSFKISFYDEEQNLGDRKTALYALWSIFVYSEVKFLAPWRLYQVFTVLIIRDISLRAVLEGFAYISTQLFVALTPFSYVIYPQK